MGYIPSYMTQNVTKKLWRRFLTGLISCWITHWKLVGAAGHFDLGAIMCIYYSDRNDLTYKNREHIFPAGLGRMKMLPQGYVSDQANALFSPLELKIVSSPNIQDKQQFIYRKLAVLASHEKYPR